MATVVTGRVRLAVGNAMDDTGTLGADAVARLATEVPGGVVVEIDLGHARHVGAFFVDRLLMTLNQPREIQVCGASAAAVAEVVRQLKAAA